MRGKVGRAGFMSRPAVPSLAGFTGCEILPFGVGDEASVERVGEPALDGRKLRNQARENDDDRNKSTTGQQ
jgi:hypothetical protein